MGAYSPIPVLRKDINPMNRKIMAAVAAMLMLTACAGGNTDDKADTADVTESVSETVPEAETSAETEAETDAETEAETDSETKAESETESDSEAASDSEQSTLYDGSFYTISVDADKWTDAKKYVQAAAEVAEGLDNGLDFTAQEYVDMCDAMFVYNADADSDFATNFNIVTQDIGTEVDMDADTLGPLMAESYDGVDAYECKGWEGVNVNGNDSLKITVATEQAGMDMDMIQYIFLKGGKQTVVTLTAKKGETERVLPDFEAIVDTIVLK